MNIEMKEEISKRINEKENNKSRKGNSEKGDE